MEMTIISIRIIKMIHLSDNEENIAQINMLKTYGFSWFIG